jgi:uncharacterized protein
MLYIRLCIDKPGTTELRESVRAEHRAYFKPNLSEDAALRLVQAGPLCVSDNDDTNLASFMVIEAASIEEVEAFHQGDPFTVAGLYDKVIIHRWDRHI